MADDLFNIKNEFFLGNFQGAINEAQASDLVLSSPADEKDRDVIVSSPYHGFLQFVLICCQLALAFCHVQLLTVQFRCNKMDNLKLVPFIYKSI